MRLFLDTNVVVDFANVAYLAKRGGTTLSQLYELLMDLRSHVHVVIVGQDCVDAALRLRPKDFEDALQYFAAKQANADYIITRNKKDFGFPNIPVFEPSEFLIR